MKLEFFNSETGETLKNFHRLTQFHPRFDYANSWYWLDQFLLGSANWNNVSTGVISERVQRFLIWALKLNDVQKQFGWTSREWGQLSPRDLSLLFHVMFEYPTIIAITCLILWKQMNNEELEHRMMNGGFSGIA